MRLQFDCIDSNENQVTFTCESTDKVHRCSGAPGVPCRGMVQASGLEVGHHISPNKVGNPHVCVVIQTITELG